MFLLVSMCSSEEARHDTRVVGNSGMGLSPIV